MQKMTKKMLANSEQLQFGGITGTRIVEWEYKLGKNIAECEHTRRVLQ